MKVLLIQATQLDDNQRPVKYKQMFLPYLTQPTLAGLTPPGIDLKIIDNAIQDIDFDEKADLVAVTSFTCQITNAFQIADEFRKRKVKTILGGIHASMSPDIILNHFDSMAISEAEEIWEEILRDAKNNNLRKVYQAGGFTDMQRLVIPRYDLLDYSKYVIPPFARTPLIPIQATRGCPHKCSFCSVNKFMGNKYRKKPVAHVLKEIEAINPSRIFFVDDNINADPAYARELFTALIPYKVRWTCQMSTQIGRHPDLIDLAAASGCHENFIGIESINPEILKNVNKGFNKVENYKQMFRRLRQAGILSQAALVLGFDGDTVDSIRRSLDTILEWDINYLYLSILTPFPGTTLAMELDRAGRIIDHNMAHYDGMHVTIQSENLKPDELMELYWETYRRFYSMKNILKRFWRFRREYRKFFPRDNGFEEFFFSIFDYFAVKKKNHPFTLGQKINS